MTETVSEEIRLPDDVQRFERLILCEPTSYNLASTWWIVRIYPIARLGGTFWQQHGLELFRSTNSLEALKVQIELQTRLSVLRALMGLPT